jgi:hypothetical protein
MKQKKKKKLKEKFENGRFLKIKKLDFFPVFALV